jgi:sodium-coupled neutral amino acid transporter 10
VITRTVCYFLLKAGTITKRRNFEMLAWHTFGSGGKFIVEISIIGFLVGTLIAFFVVIGDLGPEIISELFNIENNYALRNIIMTGKIDLKNTYLLFFQRIYVLKYCVFNLALSLFVALPLGLLRNVDSLSSVSSASVLFYIFLVFKVSLIYIIIICCICIYNVFCFFKQILSEGLGPLLSGTFDPENKVNYWRPSGVLQCIPIFSMALSCQTYV